MPKYQWGGKETKIDDKKSFKFKGKGGEYFKIWIVNILLTILTLGFYYPWAKVRTKRYFYANSLLDGRGFNYHATGGQLLVAYLIATAMIFAYIILEQLYLEFSLVLPLILFIAIPWLIYRSIKFNMRVTTFSNVHFHFKGSVKSAYLNFFIFPFLFLLSLYLFPILSAIFVPQIMDNPELVWITYLLPIFLILSLGVALYMFGLMKTKNKRYFIDNLRYGQGKFITSFKVKKFMMIAFKTVLVTLLALIGVMGMVGVAVYMTIGLESLMSLYQSIDDPIATQQKFLELLPIVVPAYVALLLSFAFGVAYSMVRQRTYIYENVLLDDKISFESTLKLSSYIWVWFTNMIFLILTLGLAYPWAKVRVSRLILTNTKVDSPVGMNEYLSLKAKEESALGEEIGDVFDLDVGIGV